jgi:superfamily II DNA/RNA helicase
MFSATMPPEIRRLADVYLNEPKEIAVTPQASPAETVSQHVAIVPGEHRLKRAALRQLIRSEDVGNAIIFCNRKRDVAIVARSLERHGFAVAALHGDMPQSIRMETLDKFKEGQIALLVASDVAARGLDVVGMSHVFNFDVPSYAEDYIHRIGRTGRAGRPGRALTLATPSDRKYVAAIERLIGTRIERIEIEGMTGVEEKREPEQRGRRERPARDQAAPPKPESRRRRRDRQPRREPREDPVVGMGDHIPAFLLR